MTLLTRARVVRPIQTLATSLRSHSLPLWKERFAALEEQVKWAVLFALALSLLTAVRDIAAISSMSESTAAAVWLWTVAAQLTLFLFWAFVAPLVLHAMKVIRDRQWNAAQALLSHALLYLGLGSVFYFFVAAVNNAIWPMPGMTAEWKYFLRAQTFIVIFLNSALKYYVPILLGGALFEYSQRMRAEELNAAQLKEQLSESHFRLLKMQLHPHFLFNALHSVSSLIYTDARRADQMIAQLSDLLRVSLDSSEVISVPLREELNYVKKYLEIERIRFSDRLEIKFSIEPDTLALDVPNLILQPLVENAVRHGMSQRSAAGVVHIRAYKHRGGLVLAVEDNGPGFAKVQTPGIGTRNVRERLGRMYAHRGRLTLQNLKPQGARQELFIPIDDIKALFEVPITELGTANG